ncbi:MAG: hypothetical protein R2853_11050 [Thermomicrobiales bacterium]
MTADQLIAGLRQVAARAHEHGITAYVATITPYEGSVVYTAQGEAIRTAVDDWIRGGDAFDGVIDFDAVVRDPAYPRHLAAYDGGDSLHFNDAGFTAMAEKHRPRPVSAHLTSRRRNLLRERRIDAPGATPSAALTFLDGSEPA